MSGSLRQITSAQEKIHFYIHQFWTIDTNNARFEQEGFTKTVGQKNTGFYDRRALRAKLREFPKHRSALRHRLHRIYLYICVEV